MKLLKFRSLLKNIVQVSLNPLISSPWKCRLDDAKEFHRWIVRSIPLPVSRPNWSPLYSRFLLTLLHLSVSLLASWCRWTTSIHWTDRCTNKVLLMELSFISRPGSEGFTVSRGAAGHCPTWKRDAIAKEREARMYLYEGRDKGDLHHARIFRGWHIMTSHYARHVSSSRR